MNKKLSRWTTAIVFASLLCSPAGPASAQTPALSNSDIVKLTQAGLSEGVIITAIADAKSSQFDVSPAALVSLKEAGVADAVIARMMARVTAAVAPPAPASPPASVRPIADAASRQAAARAGGASAMKRRSRGLMYTGVAIWGGGLTMEILANTALKKEECLVTRSFFVCESGTNKPLLYGGLGVAGAGIVMWLVGAQKVPALPSVAFRRGGASITHSVRF